MKIPSEPIRKERICQNLTEAFGEELEFLIYYCKADPPLKKKNRGGPPFTIVDVTLQDLQVIYNISVPLIRHGPSRRPVLCVARVPWVATVRRWLRRRGCETCELTELREEWPVTVELVERLAEVQSPLVLHGRVQSRKIVWWVPFYPPSWSMTKIIVLFLDIWLTPPWHLAHTPPPTCGKLKSCTTT